MITTESMILWSRYPVVEVADTEMIDLAEEKQQEICEAVGSLLIAMIEEHGEPYESDFVVVLGSGERVAYECQLSNSVANKSSMN